MDISDLVLGMSLVVGCCAVILLGIQAPLQRRMLREIADRSRLDLLTIVDELGSLQMRVENLDRGLHRLVQRIDHLQLQQATSPGHDYTQAARLARSGASTTQLVERCGVTRGEAELLQRLARPLTPTVADS